MAENTGRMSGMYKFITGEDEFVDSRLANPILPTQEPQRYVDSYGGRSDGGFFLTSTAYNVGEEKVMNTQSLYEVFVVNRDKLATDVLSAAEVYLIVADHPEAARTIALLELGVKSNELNAYHVASREVCRIPYLPRQAGLLPDNGGKVNGE